MVATGNNTVRVAGYHALRAALEFPVCMSLYGI